MKTILKYAGAAVLTGALAVAAITPTHARDGRNAAAAIGFGAGALVGAAAASANNGYYYGDPGYAYGPTAYYGNDYAYYGNDYAYEAAPVYVEPAPTYYYSRRHRHNGPTCDLSPGDINYRYCN
jgi:hypothetical protein